MRKIAGRADISDIIWKVRKRIKGDQITPRQYTKWIGNLEKRRVHGTTGKFEYEPLYSIVIPLYHTPIPYFIQLVASVKSQTYKKWELCLAEGSGNPSKELKKYLDELEQEENIKVVYSEVPLNISENTNQALEIAEGDFIVFADHDDLLSEDALLECTRALNRDKNIDLLYSDEDKVDMDGKVYFQPHFKPDFNWELLRGVNYFCHLVVVKRSLQQKVGCLRSEYDGAQDYDFVLRCAELAENICHIPRVLYHWRAHQGSLAGNTGSKDYAVEAGRRAIDDHLRRCEMEGKVQIQDIFGVYHVAYCWPEEERFSVIISWTGEEEEVWRMVSRLKRAAASRIEQIIVVGTSCLSRKEESVIWVSAGGQTNVLLHYQAGMQKVNTEYCLCLESSVEISWKTVMELPSLCRQTHAVVCGGSLVDKRGRTVNTGYFINSSNRLCFPFRGYPQSDPGYFARKLCSQEVFGVSTHCFAVNAEFFRSIEGEVKAEPLYGDISFFCEVIKKGEKTVINPSVKIYQKTEGKRESRCLSGHFIKKYRDQIEKQKKYYNVNLDENKMLYTLKK